MLGGGGAALGGLRCERVINVPPADTQGGSHMLCWEVAEWRGGGIWGLGRDAVQQEGESREGVRRKGVRGWL